MNPPAPLRTHVGLRLNTFQPATKPAVPSIGPWELVRQVHEGAMFRVHQVRPLERDSSSTAGYALKELLPRWDHVPAAIELLAVESLVGRSVSDPHLVAVLSSELAQKPRYVVTPWLQGETLATIVRRGRLKVPQALWIVRQLVEALRALHSAGWLHGDVKPDNVLVSPRGHVTLIDLGFARRIGERVTSFDDCLRFTATYAPPEITGSQPPDVRSDLYSVGVTLYETLTGHPPFYAPRVDELLRMHREERPQDVRMLASNVPSDVAKLVQQLLAKDPLRRPHSAAELVDELINLEIATFDQR